VIQTLSFEVGGLAVITPVFALVTDTQLGTSFGLLLAVSLVVTLWTAFFNTTFDLVEHRLTGRLASNRPHRWRTLHAVLHEATAVIVSCPVIWALTDLGWIDGLLVDLGLTVAYAVYAYLFYWGYDRLRPMQPKAT
jgi:uncharacterized membrane protein